MKYKCRWQTIFLLLLFLTTFSVLAQNANDWATLKYRNVGPNRGGRVTAIAGVISQKNIFYMGATGGGLWKTTNYGNSWDNISDGYFATPSIGAIGVYQNNPNIIYVGTGSDGLRSNVIAGKGVYKSTDAGKTWKLIGLEQTGQIGAVRVDPTNPDIAYVAAIGNAFKNNEDRGIFKTIDGGASWTKILYHSDSIGFVDIEIAANDPNTLYAAAWRAERKPWTIISGSNEGGIYKSVDAGKTWEKLSQGLPQGLIGKIDIAVTPADPNNVYAIIEAPLPKGGLYTSTDRGATWNQISDDKDLVNRPFYYLNLYAHPVNSGVLFSNALNFIRSNDGGKTWEKLSTPHGDNHDMWINPTDTMVWIQSNDGGANITLDAGKSWSTQFNQPTSELYTVDVDDQYPYWLYAGQQDNYSTIAVPSRPPYGVQAGANAYIINTGGCETGPAVPKPGNHNIVYSNCKGRFGVYDKRTDQEKQYYVGATNMYGHNPKDLQYRFQRVAPILVSPHNADVVYHGSQFLHKTTNDGVDWATISPDLTAFEADKQVISGSPITRDVTGEEYYSTLYEIAESTLQQGQIWVGSNDGVVSLTLDGGDTWKNVTPEGLPKGGRVDCIEPSYHKNGTAYAAVLRTLLGDDKPYLYKTTDFGKSWELLSKPNNGIPADASVRVVREDPKKEGILYAGTESGMYISFDEGQNWTSFQQNLPLTPINDIRVFRNDLILATMGRGFWIMDDISPLHAKSELTTNQLLNIQPAIKYNYRGSSKDDIPEYPSPAANIHYYVQSDPESIQLDILDVNGNLVNSYIDKGKGASTDVKRDMATEFYNSPGKKVLTKNVGLNSFQWDMSHFGPWSDNERRSYMNGPYVTPGIYTVVLTVADQKYSKKLTVLADPRVIATGTTQKDMDAQIALSLKIRDLLTNANTYANEIKKELDLVKGKSKSKTQRLQGILDQLQTPDGTYMQPLLIDQIGYLASMLKQADQMPGSDAYTRYENLAKELQVIKSIKK